MSESELYTVKEFAQLMRVHVQTVYSAIRYDRFPFRVIRLKNTIRICVPRGSIKHRKESHTH